VKTQSEIDDFVSRYRKYYDEQEKARTKQNESSEKHTNDEKETRNPSEQSDQNSRNKKAFEEPEIVDFSKTKNPVEKVIEEYVNEGKKELVQYDDSNKSSNKDQIRKTAKKPAGKLQKTSNNKPNANVNKTKAPKVKEVKIKAGTSNWFITPTESTKDTSNSVGINNKKIDLDEMFDSVEDKIQEKINKKLASMKRLQDKQTKNEIRMKRKRKNDDLVNDIDKLGLKGQQKMKPMIDKPMEESTDFNPSNHSSESQNVTNIANFNSDAVSQTKKAEIDPNKFMNVKPVYLKTALPNEIAGEEDALDDSEGEDQHQIISEAFADDDVVDEFQRDKEEEVN
jgi:hypothetical protein